MHLKVLYILQILLDNLSCFLRYIFFKKGNINIEHIIWYSIQIQSAATPLSTRALSGLRNTDCVQQMSHKSVKFIFKQKNNQKLQFSGFDLTTVKCLSSYFLACFSLGGKSADLFGLDRWHSWENERWFHIMEKFVGWRAGARVFFFFSPLSRSEADVPPLLSSPAAGQDGYLSANRNRSQVGGCHRDIIRRR